MTQADFENIILGMKENLYRFALSILGCSDDAQDAVQEVVLRLWNQRKQLDKTKNIESFCMSAIRNYCIDTLRKRKQQEQYIGNNNHNDSELPVHDTKDLVHKIRHELNGLPLQQRIAVELKDFQGYEYQEISEMLNLPVNAIRVSVSRGRKRLFEIFKEELAYE
ncbi:RNA polymerase sigma factor [Sunxiuqinia sp. A32]|uniref:RNA polymerase sigma factor n=1 Tax=Sunxiuqinia sp. A32 TaxID=3461496 RepID=UPI0040460149